jgi:DNA-binding winged helix-turn-helix (wHTH) protein/tetratricopeptide (TPR) repeat protein
VKPLTQRQFYEFDAFRIDTALSRLARAGELVPLPPKAFDLLVLLARNTDRVMTKAELIEALWPNTFVDEANLTQHVYMLRKALGDRPNGQPFIETVPRRGYRLATSVRKVVDATPAHAAAGDVVRPPSDSSTTSLATVPLAPEGEWKRATVLDCRIANAAAVVERLGPVTARDLTRDLLKMAAEELGRYGGVITERRADGFVALFGAPVVHEDDGRRAVLAALGLQQQFGRLAAESNQDEPLNLRIGLGTGALVVTRAGSHADVEYAAVGEPARVADLLQQLASPGMVLIGDTTRRAVDGYIDTLPSGSHDAAGAVFRVVGALGRHDARSARLARTLAPFVGRHHELAMLGDLASLARAGKGQAVSIVGDPGIGKSRLLHECTQHVAAPAGMAVLEGRCLSYGSNIPYLPVADVIRTHCGVRESDPPEHMRLAVARTTRDDELPAESGTWLLRVIGGIDTSGATDALSPEAVKARTFDALRTLFFKAAKRTPLLIALEDIHWIDRTSEEFLTTLVERLAGAPIIVVTTCRPGYRVPWLDRSYLTHIALRPLTAADSAQLVESVAREQPLLEAVSAALVEKGDGNPFFLEELARTVVERGADSRAIPDTVQGVIMARVDRLSEVAKHLLQTASVIGREVSLQLLDRVWRGSEYASDLEELCRLEFLYEKPGADEPAVIFKHALTQDVTYDSLLARTRRELHLRTAQALAGLYSDRDDVAATLAYHYARTDLVDEAVRWLIRAADRAARLYANAEAVLHLNLAARRLQRLPEGPDRDRRMLDVALRHAHSLYFLGRFRESVEVLLPHEAPLARLNEPALTATYSFWLAHMHSRLGDQRRACDNAARAIAAADRAGDEETLGKAHGLLALEGHWSGNTADGISHGHTSVDLLGSHPQQRWWLGMTHFYLAMNHLVQGDFEAALAEANRADAIGKNIGDPRLQTYAAFTVGWVEATRRNDAAAVAACQRSLEQAPDRVSRAYASMVLGFALIGQGDHAQARTTLEPMVAELEGFAFPQWHGFAAALTAEAYRLDARHDVAGTLVERALDVMTRAHYWYGVAFAQRVAARIALDRGACDKATAAFDDAAGTFERIGAQFEAQQTRDERDRLNGAIRNPRSGTTP